MPLSIHDRGRLRDYFKASVPKPGWRPWLGKLGEVPDDIAVTLKGIEVKVAGAAGAFRKLTLESRVRHASYNWFFPFEDGEHSTLERGLPYVQIKAGLSHLSRREVIDHLQQEATRIIQEHPDLAAWIRYRRALLEYEDPVDRLPEFREVEFMLRNELFRSLGPWFDRSKTLTALDELVGKSLKAAAQAVHAVLGGDSGGRLTASLMLPGNPRVALRFLQHLGLDVDAAARRAQELWQDLPERDRSAALVIVAEAVVQNSPRHVGFWVPLAQGNNGAKLPGAPEAYSNLIGSTVFCHDVPPLRGFSDTLNQRWRTHITTQVSGRHFVSVPFVVDETSGGGFAGAVVNVNADPDEGHEWFRALHGKWLQRATEAASPFAEISFHAVRARFALLAPHVGDVGLLETLPDAWRALTSGSAGANPVGLLHPTPTTDGDEDDSE